MISNHFIIPSLDFTTISKRRIERGLSFFPFDLKKRIYFYAYIYSIIFLYYTRKYCILKLKSSNSKSGKREKLFRPVLTPIIRNYYNQNVDCDDQIFSSNDGGERVKDFKKGTRIIERKCLK